MQTIAIIEDNEAIRDAVVSYLKIEDYNTVEFSSCEGVVDYVKKKMASLLIMDIALPDGNGFLLVKQIRSFSDVPIIFLTSRTSESDRILGFELGADDYLQKPFSPKELILRIKAVLRRNKETPEIENVDDDQQWESGSSKLIINFQSHKLNIDGLSIKFTSTEWKILSYLISNAQVVLSREQILDHSLDYSFDGYDRIVDTHIKNIRAKLGSEEWIETVRGYGYNFCGKIIL